VPNFSTGVVTGRRLGDPWLRDGRGCKFERIDQRLHAQFLEIFGLKGRGASGRRQRTIRAGDRAIESISRSLPALSFAR
jgi:hypothetical protein